MVKKTLKEFSEDIAGAELDASDMGEYGWEGGTGPSDAGPWSPNGAVEPDDGLDDRPAIMAQKTLTLSPPQAMEDEWVLAANVAEVVDRLSRQHDLPAKNFRIACLWKRKGGRSQGRNNLGGVKFYKGGAKILSRQDGELWLAADHHEHSAASEIEATILHLLLSIGEKEEDGSICRVYPDFRGYLQELEIAGAHNYELAKAKAAFEQAHLPMHTD